MENLLTWPYVLRRGHSQNPALGACAMDAVNWLVHGRHGDLPECACPVISRYVVVGNDEMSDKTRQRLIKYLHRIAGTRSAAHVKGRMRILQLAGLRIFAPRALLRAGLPEEAEKLRSLPDGVDMAEAALAAHAAAIACRAVYLSHRAVVFSAASAADDCAADAAAACVAQAAAGTFAWDDYFRVLDDVLNAGPQGEPWSADAVTVASLHFVKAGGVAQFL